MSNPALFASTRWNSSSTDFTAADATRALSLRRFFKKAGGFTTNLAWGQCGALKNCQKWFFGKDMCKESAGSGLPLRQAVFAS
jgi:hypothetical protein